MQRLHSHHQPVQVFDGFGATAYSYTAAGQLATELGPVSGMAVTNTYSNRLRVALQASSAWTNGFAYDSAGRLTNVISKAGSFTNVYYAGPGGGYSSRILRQVWFPNLSVITNDFDPVARLLATHLRTSAGVLTNKHEYAYDLVGARTNQTRIDGITIPYGYDKIGQLKTAYVSGGSALDQWRYGYDAGWNLTRRTNATIITTYTFNNANELTVNGSPSYDSNGNLISYNTTGYTYDDENRLIEITSTNQFQTQFGYDGFGRLRTRTEYLWVDNGDGTGFWNYGPGQTVDISQLTIDPRIRC